MAMTFGGFLGVKWYYQALVVILLAGGALGGFWYMVLQPLEAEVANKETQLEGVNAQIMQAEARLAQLEQFRLDAEQVERELAVLRLNLPEEQQTDEIIREVVAAAREAGMSVNQIAPRAIVDGETYSEWAWDFQVTSTYHNMARFLDAIRQLPRIVNISGIVMQPGGDGQDTTIGANYTATTFVYREEAPE